MTQQIPMWDGQQHPVTDGWYAQNVASWPAITSLTASGVATAISNLLALSNTRQLSDDEEAYLQALTRLKNANVALKAVAGRDYAAEFGFEGVDQIHGNSASFACGCKLHYIFDHNKAQAGEQHEHHPHHPLRVCKAHAELSGDFKAHFAKVVSDHKA